MKGYDLFMNENNNNNNNGTNNNNNLEEMFARFLQYMEQQNEQYKENNRKWCDIPIEEINRGHLIQFKETTIPVKQISGKNYQYYGVVYTSQRSGAKYSWNYYGDVQYMTIEDLSEMLDREKNYIKKELKPLDNRILKLYDLEEYYELIEYVNGIEIKELVSKPIEEQSLLMNRIKKELSEDTYADLRSRVCFYFITAKDNMTLGELRNILPVYKLTEYDVRISNNEVRGNISFID